MHAEAFLQHLLLVKRYSDKTVAAYKLDIQQFQDYLLHHWNVANLDTATSAQVKSWLVAVLRSGMSIRTVNRKKSTLRAYFRFLLKEGHLASNPVSGLKLARTPSNLPKAIPQFPLSKALDNLINEEQGIKTEDSLNEEIVSDEKLRNQLIILLLYGTGIRREELINLRRMDFDQASGMIKVRGKRKKERIIPLPDQVKPLLTYWLTRQKGIEAESPVFSTPKGKKIYPMLVHRVVHDFLTLVQEAESKSPHAFRHSYATHLLNQGADLNAVKDLLGHSSLAATQVYTNLSVERLLEVYRHFHPRS